MTREQFEELRKIIKPDLHENELEKMGFTPINGVFDDDVDYDIGLYKFEEAKRQSDLKDIEKAKKELAAINDLITQANTRLLELGTTAARSINPHRFNEIFVQLHTTFLKALSEARELKELFL